ncbi:MAG: FGGY-family carbohydrate kinase [Clostridiales bacterium]|nr:FGGY-family carbohydrate kinase [Clostridiales bacterium]
MNNPYILAIDCGTQSTRAIIFDSKGNIIAKVKKSFEPYFSKEPGWGEQDPELYWDSLCFVCKTLKQQRPLEWDKVIAVSLTTQRDTCVLLDKNGEVLRPAILWLDQRMAECKTPMSKLHNFMITVGGVKEQVLATRKKFRANWIRENQPEIWEKTDKYLYLSGYLIYKLTGNFLDSVASQIGHIPLDHKNRKWAEKNDIISAVCDIERAKLVKLVEPTDILGTISKKVSEETGINEGLKLIASGSDKGCETLGVGCLDYSVGNISLGSTATIQTTVKDYFEPIRFFPSYATVIPNHFNPEVQIYRGYWMISWFKKEFAEKEVAMAKEINVTAEELLNRLLDDVPAGSHGLILQPLWGSGIRKPYAKGAIIGFSDVHTRKHIYRAIIEGIGFALLEGIEAIEKKTKHKMEKIAISGGGSQSDAICQITADIFNREAYRVQTYETSGLGAAITAFVGIGFYETFDDAVKEMVHRVDVFKPNNKNVETYAKLYKKVYKKIFPSLKNLYSKIRQITKY